MMVKLCRDYEFMLLKFVAVVGQLRDEKQVKYQPRARLSLRARCVPPSRSGRGPHLRFAGAAHQDQHSHTVVL